MSIINDALKKAEKTSQLSRNNSPKKRWLFWAAAGVVCLSVVFLATGVFKGPADSVSVEETIAKPELPSSAFKMREIDLKFPLKSTDFKLSGILYDEQKPMAIINNRVVEEGALINGAQLLEIQPNFVRLSRRGKKFTLIIK